MSKDPGRTFDSEKRKKNHLFLFPQQNGELRKRTTNKCGCDRKKALNKNGNRWIVSPVKQVCWSSVHNSLKFRRLIRLFYMPVYVSDSVSVRKI